MYAIIKNARTDDLPYVEIKKLKSKTEDKTEKEMRSYNEYDDFFLLTNEQFQLLLKAIKKVK